MRTLPPPAALRGRADFAAASGLEGREKGEMMKILKKVIAAAVSVGCLCLLFAACSILSGGSGGGGNGGKKYDLSDPLISYRLTSDPDPVYDGAQKQRGFVITYDGGRIDQVNAGEEHPDLQTEYSDNVNAGTAKIVVTPKASSKKYTSSLTVLFEILPIGEPVEVSDFAALKGYLSPANYAELHLVSDMEIPAGESVVIGENTSLLLQANKLVNRGELENRGTVEAEGDEGAVAESFNYGTITNKGRFQLLGNVAFFNEGVIKNEGVLYSDSSSGFYSSTQLIGKAYERFYQRAPLSDCEISLSFESAVYTGKELRPTVNISLNGETVASGEFDRVYTDNMNVGTACVTVTADRYAKRIFGTETLHFSVERASVTVVNPSGFFLAIASGNYDEVTVQMISKLDGTITVPSYMSVTFTSYCTFSQKVTNGGTLVLSAGGTFGDVLENNGAMRISESCRFKEKAVNEGSADIFSGAIVYNDGGFENSGELHSLAVWHNKGDFVNGGTAKNGGKFYCYREGSVSGVSVQNEGTAFVDGEDARDFFAGGSVVVRKAITADDVTLSENSFVYDGKTKIPNLQFVKTETGSGSTYKTEFRYDGASAYASAAPADAGNVQMRITFQGNSEVYCGSAELSFEIRRGTYSASGTEDILAGLANRNYDSVIVVKDIEATQLITVREGYTLTVAEGVEFIARADIVLYGKLENCGRYAEGGTGNYLCVGSGGAFENAADGTAFFNGTLPDGVEEGAGVFVRRALSSLSLRDFAEQVTYSAAGTPKPQIFLYDGEQMLEKGSDFSAVYSNAVYATKEGQPASVVCKADIFSEKYFGSLTKEYGILRAQISVTGIDELIAALGDVRSDDETFCNYEKIFLAADLTAKDPESTVYLTVHPDVTFVIGSYGFSLSGGSIGHGFYYVVNNGIIEITDECGLRSSAVYKGGSGKVIGYADSADKVSQLCWNADIVVLTADLGDCSFTTPNFGEESTLDLNGHSMSSLLVKLWGVPLRICSSAGGGAVGTEGSSGSLNLNEIIGEGKTLTLRDITVYGIKYGNSSYAACVRTEGSAVIS